MKKIDILFVDDDKVDQMAFKRSITEDDLPYRYKIADSVVEAKECFKKYKFDIAVLDYNLSDGTAFDLFDDARETPIIIATGQGREEVAVEAMKKGAFDYLTKDPERVYLKMMPIAVENAIKNKKARDEHMILSHAIMSESDSVCITDLNNRIIYVNKAFTVTYGFEEEEVIGKHIYFLWKKESIDDISARKKIAATRISGNWSGETKNIKKGGEYFIVNLSRSIVKDDNGSSIAVVEIARDITERKNAEKERETLIADLKDAIANVKCLRELLPICASCKKIRDDKGYWSQVEVYITKHTDTLFSHGLCPDCAKKLYPDLDPKIFEKAMLNKD